ncbi:site-specific DNA-methyltransferase [Inhella sp.]|uniref:site-specific DNA-methyltransferase n=1 Tax=Inhella sp. TaxID=1921806 RepID=UPI0035AF8C74
MTDNIKKPKDVTVAKAKGRPMLTWVGKKPLARVRAYPAQAIERFDATAGQAVPLQEANWSDWPKDLPKGGLLYHGDNKDVLAHLLANGFRGKVKLIYIDPPFDSGADYVRKVQLRGAKGTVKIDGEDYTLGEQVQYSDIWANDNYLQFMFERLLMLRELLSDEGALYLHCDWNRSHQLRMILDEVFSADFCRNEIIWKRTSARSDSKFYNHIHDVILFYSKGDAPTFNEQFTPYEKSYLDKYFGMKDPDGRRFASKDATQAGLRNGATGTSWRGFNPASKGNHWKVVPTELDRLDREGRIYWPEKDGGWPRLKQYLDETKGRAIQSIWDDVMPVNSQAEEREEYPTQKPVTLLERLIRSSTNSDDIVLDCFIGSGTTAAVAQQLGRRWIGCDINKGAIQTTAKRIQELMRTQAQRAARPQQGDLIGTAETDRPPSQLSFATYRVNDYDLQIQHNEAVELACQHLGVTRTRTDSFFEGTQGGRLVKIVPFNHPLTPLDLEVVRNELKTRPTEERDVMVVCLGWQHDARAWVETYNRNRPVNKLHVVELRTDRKLGGIIKHEPLTAQISAKRTGEGANAQLVVEVQDVVSPTIMQRLNLEQGVFRAQITDWRAVVDCILIDTQYDGEVFSVTLADVPERKQDLVSGCYELPAPPAGSTVAVKVIDMLGEELVVPIAV